MQDLDSETVLINDGNLPAVFRAADVASGSAQRNYLRLILADLGMVLGSALATSFAVSSQDWRFALALFGAGCFLGGLVLTGLVIRTGFDRRWFQARAVAESAKTMAWRYMARAEPYETKLSDVEADRIFCEELESMLQSRRRIAGALGGREAEGEQITEQMRSVRAAELEVRKAVYLRDRLRQQRSWYSNKAKSNENLSDLWLYAIALFQILGAAAAIALVRWPNLL